VGVISPEEIRRIAVVGSGTMGAGIARVAAVAGCAVRLFDAQPGAAAAAVQKIGAALGESAARGEMALEQKDRALAGLRACAQLPEALEGADVVVEAVPENLDLKQRLFAQLGSVSPAGALLGSNTSSLSISRIAERCARPEAVVGLHFFNPPHRMKLLEVVRGASTSAEALAAAVGFARRLGKEPIVVRDSPGFATSRLGLALGLEAMRMLEEGVASAEEIDKAMALGYGHPMGPLRVSDLVGLDVRLSIAETLARELGGDRFEPPEILKRKVREGKLGKKAGEGFYRWER